MAAWLRTPRAPRLLGWWVLLAATLGITAILDQLGQGVVVHLEFAGTAARFEALLTTRPGLDLGDLRLASWIDYAYMAAYATLLWSGCRWAAARVALSPTVARAGRALAVGAVAAAGLDAIENAGMLANLDGPVRDHWALLTTTATWPKWVLVIAALAYVAAAGVVRAARFLSRRRPPFTAGVPGPSGGDQPSWLGPGAWDPTPGKRAVCFSGGGIRSASYALGALQALSADGVLQTASHVTAVSGGSYLAGAWAIAERHRADGGRGDDPWAPGSPEERWLRNHTTYLIDGPAQAVRAGLRFLAGAAVNIGVLYVALFALARPAGWVLSSWSVVPGLRGDATPSISIPTHLWLPGVAVAAFAGLAALALVNTRGWRRATTLESIAIGAGALAAVLLAGLVVAPLAVEVVPRALANALGWVIGDRVSDPEAPRRTVNAVWLLESLGLLTVLTAALRAMFRRARGPLVSLATRLVVPGMAVLAAIYLLAGAALRGPRGRFAILHHDLGPEWAVWLAVVAGYGVFFLMSDLVTWSLHPYYKARLRSAFALKRSSADVVEPLPADEERTLDDYPATGGPQLVVCAAANLSDRGLTPPGAPVRPFTFSSTEVGDRELGWVHPSDLTSVLGRRRREDATVSTAVAVSGAAFSPAMGKMGTHRPLALLALVNARLGVWYPHPRWVAALKMQVPGVPWFVRTRFGYLFRELFGWYAQSSRLLYVTDGGHVENLGLVEALRRGCTEVWCFDASGDRLDTFRTLGEAIALARAELGIEIDIDPTPMVPDPESPRRAPVDAVVGRIRYGGRAPDGTLYYAKTAVTADAPWDVRAFAEHDLRFPTHSTGDQFFDHEQFEAYRALGSFTARRLVQGRALLRLFGAA